MNVLNLGIISLCWSLDVMNPFLSPQLKKFGKIQLKSKLSLGLIYGLAFGFKQHLIFQRAEFKKLVLYSQGHNCYLILKLLKANFWFAFKFATCEHGVKLLVKFAFIIFDLAYLKGIVAIISPDHSPWHPTYKGFQSKLFAQKSCKN